MTEAYWTAIDEAAGVWCREYAFDSQGKANCCVVRVGDGELAVLSPAMEMSDAGFAELEKHGKPVALIAPNGFHHLGVPAWKKRYPDARLFAHPVAAKRIRKQAPDLGDFESCDALAGMLSDDVWIGIPEGMKHGDVVARVRLADGHFWYFNDLVMNLPRLPGNFAIRTLFKLTKSGPGFAVTRLIVKFLVKDKRAFKAWLLQQLKAHPPTRIVTGHGAPIVDASVAAKLPQMVEAAV